MLVTTFRTHFCRKETGGIKSWVLLLTKMELEKLDCPFPFTQWTTSSTGLWPPRKRKHKVSPAVIPAYCVELVSSPQHTKGEPKPSPATLLSWKRQSLREWRWLQSLGQNTSQAGSRTERNRSSAVSPNRSLGKDHCKRAGGNSQSAHTAAGGLYFHQPEWNDLLTSGPWAAESSKGNCFPSGAQSSLTSPFKETNSMQLNYIPEKS